MRIEINRYYFGGEVTKSRIAVTLDGSAEPDMTCEGRETGYVAYTADRLFAGWTSCCLPQGRLAARTRATTYGPMTIAVGPTPTRLRTLVAWHPRRQTEPGRLLVGYADDSVEPDRRTINRQQEAFRRLEELTRHAFYQGEGIEVSVS